MTYPTCVSVAEETPDHMLKALDRALEVSRYAELRLDYLDISDIPAVLESASSRMDRLVCTLRPRREGGRFAGPESRRIRLLETISGYRPYLTDIEFSAVSRDGTLARRLKGDIMVSWHDFGGTPSFASLRRRLHAMARYCGMVKMVSTAKGARDAARVLGLYAVRRDTVLVAFAMGEAGRFSRVCSLYLGCPFAYVSLGRPVAPGQYSLEDLRRVLDII